MNVPIQPLAAIRNKPLN